MKTLFASLAISLALLLNAVSAENVPASNPGATFEVTTITNNNITTTTTTTNSATLQATLNDVVIDILRGAKSAGSEVYQASKSAVVASVDFAKNQVPDVVEQFLKWKITEKVVYIVGWLVIAVLLVYISRSFNTFATNFRKNSPDSFTRYSNPVDYDFAIGFKWFTRVGAVVIVVINIWLNGMTIAKILIAPKVYLIEYVVDTIQSNQPRIRH